MSSETTSISPLRRPSPDEMRTIISWSATPEETARWCSSREHPLSPNTMRSWWNDAEIEPWVLDGADGKPIGYGELWLDAEENEVELARLIVDPDARGQGRGRQLVEALKAKAVDTGLASTILRVVPDNAITIRCYLATGFEQLGPDETAEWNQGQPQEYVWMTVPRSSRSR